MTAPREPAARLQRAGSSGAEAHRDGALRPFGAHLTMRWWVPLVLTVLVVVSTYVLQALLSLAAALIEINLWGKDPSDASLTPLTYLATNLAIILIAPLTLVVLTKASGAPWRSVLAVTRTFDWRRLGTYLCVFAALMVIVNVAVQIVQPSPASAFAVTGTTVALLAVVALTTPLQAAAEELTFRGVLTASYGPWVRASRPALVWRIEARRAAEEIDDARRPPVAGGPARDRKP